MLWSTMQPLYIIKITVSNSTGKVKTIEKINDYTCLQFIQAYKPQSSLLLDSVDDLVNGFNLTVLTVMNSIARIKTKK